MKLNKQNKLFKILIILYTLISIGSTIYLLFRSPDAVNETRYQETKQELNQIKEFLRGKDSTYRNKIRFLNGKNDSLNSELGKTHALYKYSQAKAHNLKSRFYEFVWRYDLDTVLKKNESAFDSLSTISKNFIGVSEHADSLCNENINTLKKIIIVKDSALKNSDMLLLDYKSNAETLLKQSQDLNESLNLSEKKVKHKRGWNKLLSTATCILAGYVISTQLHH